MFKSTFALCLAVSIAAGCGGATSTQPVEKSNPLTKAPVPAPTPAILAGSTWLWENFLIAFRDGKAALVRGPAVVSSYPDGLDATYALKDGAVEVQALDEVRNGTYDGQKLVIENEPAVRVDPCSVSGTSIAAKVLFVDPYGNIVTNIFEADLQKGGMTAAAMLNIKIGDKTLSAPLVKNYADVAEGAYLARTQSMGLVELAINWGKGPKTRIADTLQASVNTPVVITRAG